MDSLIQENKIDYKPSSSLSLCHFNELKIHTPNQPSANSGGVIEYVLNLNSNDFIDGRTSKMYISFEGIGGNGNFTTPGGACALFKSVQLISKDGQLIDNVDNVHRYVGATDRFKMDMGFYDGPLYDEMQAVSGPSLTGVIPLYKLMPLFKYSQLLPPQLMNGMRIRFTLEDKVNCLKTSTCTDYTVKSKLFLNTYTMDSKLTEIVAKTPMVIDFDTYIHKEHEFLSNGTQVSINMPANFTCAKATRALVTSIQQPANDARSYICDESKGYYSSARWKIGNQYTAELATHKEQFLATSNALDEMRNDHTGASCGAYSTHWGWSYLSHAISLKRSPNGNGFTPCDNNYTIEFMGTKNATTNQVAHMFVEYIKRIEIKDGKLSIIF